MGIQGIVTRTSWTAKPGANQRISVEEALRVHTINSAPPHEESAKVPSPPANRHFVVPPTTCSPSIRKIKDIATSAP